MLTIWGLVVLDGTHTPGVISVDEILSCVLLSGNAGEV